MKVKINDVIYDDEETAILLMLTEGDKRNIRGMMFAIVVSILQ